MSATYIVGSGSTTVNAGCLFRCLSRIFSEPPRLVVVDLRPLQLVRIIDVDGLPFREEIDGRDRRFAMPVASLLGAAEGQMRLGPNRRRVHVNDSGVKVARGLKSLIHIARINRRRQSVRNAVSHFNSLLEAIDWNDRDDGTKNLFLRDAHLRRAIAKYGRGVEPALLERAAFETIPPGEELGPFVLANFDVAHHGLQLLLVDTWSHIYIRIKTYAPPYRFHTVHNAVNDF